jgi:hypothetical protein
MPDSYGPHSEDVVYAVAKALHKAGYGEDVVEMREAAQAALDAAHDPALGDGASVMSTGAGTGVNCWLRCGGRCVRWTTRTPPSSSLSGTFRSGAMPHNHRSVTLHRHLP